MASHFSSIGFVVDEAGFGRLAAWAAEQGQRAGAYVRWRAGAGAELWAQVGADGALVGLVPHFDGGARMRIGITATIKRPGDSPLDGACYGWAEPEDDGTSGLFPLVFDQPDHHLLERALPSIATVQLAAFAETPLTLFATRDAYADPTRELKMAIESFIPTGTFTPNGGRIDPPEALAFFTGTILAAELRTNPSTSTSFHYLRVRTLGGEVDVVADPSFVPSEPVQGGVVQGSFWLSGRIVE